MIFPLPLTPWEEYMLIDDRPEHPMNFFVRLRFAGRFDRSALDAALTAAASRHPLLWAVARRSGRRWMWVPSDLSPAVRWLRDPPGDTLPASEPLDVRTAPGLRAVASEEGQRTDLTLQVHHACCDGVAFSHFMDDMLVSYGRLRGVPGPTLPPLDSSLLSRRGRFGLPTGRLLKVLAGQTAGWRRVYRFLMLRPGPLVGQRPDRNPRGAAVGYPASLTRSLGEEETRALLDTARLLDVTVNDLMLRAFFVSTAAWFQHAAPGDPDRIRICVPVNLRATADPFPAANVVSYVFVDRRVRQTEDSEQLLISIRDEMRQIKRRRFGLLFLLGLSLWRRLPGALERMTRRPDCMATGVLSNMGVFFAGSPLLNDRGQLTIGDVVLLDTDQLGPLRPRTHANIAVWSYARRLCFTLHYDPRLLTADEASAFADSFTEDIRRAIAKRSI